MSPSSVCRLAFVSAVLQTFALAQTPVPPPPQLRWGNLPQPPVPTDPLELVSGNAQPVQDAAQRAAIVNLLANARSLSNVRAQPYDLKTSFISSGASASDGSWQLENTSPGRGLYRWTAQGPGYSVINLFQNGLLYSSQPGAGVPLRLAQVHAAIFNVDTFAGPRASIRMASANLNGTEVTCALVTRMSPPKAATGGRQWDESEFCIEPKSGLLMTYSPVPGLYILYDYSSATHFHDKIIPGKFTITEAGHSVIEARTESVSDPGNLDRSLFDPATLTSVGVGPLETPPWNFRSRAVNSTGAALALQVVVVHAMVLPDGRVTDAETIASSDAALNQQALERTANWRSWRGGGDAQPGATPQSHEMFFTFEFLVGAS